MKRIAAITFFCLFYLIINGNASAEVLKVGIDAEIPPFVYITSNGLADQYDGFDIAVIKAIAEDQGMKLKLENMPVDSLMMGLKTGNIDAAISAMTITPARKRAVSFSEPYFVSNLSMIVPDNSPIKKAADMEGKRITVVLGSTSEVAVKKLGFPYEALKAFPEGLVELKNGKCDVFVVDETIARRYCSNIKGVKILQDSKSFGTRETGIAVNKKKTELLEKINASLEKL